MIIIALRELDVADEHLECRFPTLVRDLVCYLLRVSNSGQFFFFCVSAQTERVPHGLRQNQQSHCSIRDEWLFLTAQDKPWKTDELATVKVYTDADRAGDAKSISACKPGSICDVTPRQEEDWDRDKVCPGEHDT